MKKKQQEEEEGHKEEILTNGKYGNHEDILEVFKKSFSNSDDDSIVKRYRLRLNEPRGQERVRISMGGSGRDIVEIYGNNILIKERKAFHILNQDPDIKSMLTALKELNRLHGAG